MNLRNVWKEKILVLEVISLAFSCFVLRKIKKKYISVFTYIQLQAKFRNGRPQHTIERYHYTILLGRF